MCGAVLTCMLCCEIVYMGVCGAWLWLDVLGEGVNVCMCDMRARSSTLQQIKEICAGYNNNMTMREVQ